MKNKSSIFQAVISQLKPVESVVPIVKRKPGSIAEHILKVTIPGKRYTISDMQNLVLQSSKERIARSIFRSAMSRLKTEGEFKEVGEKAKMVGGRVRGEVIYERL